MMSPERSASRWKLGSRDGRCVQRPMLQDADRPIVGKNADLGATVAIPNEIA
jgi:hypothetical protein